MRNCVLFLALALTGINHVLTMKALIIGGKRAEPGQFPFYAYLEIKVSASLVSTCGATIINDEWIVTAAHCLMNAILAKVHVGEFQLHNPAPEHKIYLVEVHNMYSHPGYKHPFSLNDIGKSTMHTVKIYFMRFSPFIISVQTVC